MRAWFGAAVLLCALLPIAAAQSREPQQLVAQATPPLYHRCCYNAAAPTPTPVPTATPTASPTPTPTPSNQYVYHGCGIFPPGDTFNTSYAGASPDPNSATIISQLPVGNFDNGDVQGAYQVNLGTTGSTPTFTVGTVGGGHNPPFYNATNVPWVDGWFIESLSDHHAFVMTTDTCLEYEMYGAQWTSPSGPLDAYSGLLTNLSATWASQAVNGRDAVTASGIPYMGTTDWGEDASLSVINHILGFVMATGQGYSQWGYVFPATSPSSIADTGCSGGACHHPIHNGDIWVLNPSFDCSPYSPKGQLVCNQLKSGIVLEDQAGSYTLRFGLTTSGSEGWNYTTDLKSLLSSITMRSGYIAHEGTILCAAGHTYGVDCW